MPFSLHRSRKLSEPAGFDAIAAETPLPAVAAERPTIGLIVGLGNPGAEYSATRHNVGFWTINRLARSLGIDVGKHTRLVSVGEGQHDGQALVLARPRTFMNNSGDAIRELLRRYKLRAEQMLLIYDDLDLPVGRVRVRARGGTGGQKGMRSIVAAAGTEDFPRIRIGIGRPSVGGEPTWDPERVADWVLGVPSAEHKRLLEAAAATAAEAALCCLDAGVVEAMNRYNKG